ncbi:MAG: Gfo/Idh/MocA family oxidoreductase [Clostridia bacterium]|nr:Gfo/Idh/MocA family oxidoreductase [Oscillospiraceae bacterium]MBQ7033972.1 Gfo/Idh/MocA family oxidoreductase [Clostridia bacterium]
MKEIRIGIIGTGNLAAHHAKNYNAIPGVALAACCDLNRERAEEFAKTHNVEKVYDTFEELVKDPSLDAVSVVTWNNAHCAATIAALEAGLHVLCEKPMAMNAEEGKRMQAAAEKSGKLLMIGFVRRFGINADIAKSYVESGALGNIYYAKTRCIRRCGNPLGWFADKARSGGGPLIDLGVHMIDLARYLMGKPCAVSAYGVTNNSIGPQENIKFHSRYTSKDPLKDSTVEDFASALVRFDNGAALQVEVSFNAHIEKDELSLELLGDKGGMTIEPELQLHTVQNDILSNVTPVYSVPKDAFSSFFAKEIQHFVACVRGEETVCRNPAEDGVELMKILDAIYKSAETGSEVKID